MTVARIIPLLVVALATLRPAALAQDAGADGRNLLRGGGFEEGLAAPWGTGQYSAGREAWWNSGNCRSEAQVDRTVRRGGAASLHIRNTSPRAGGVYGTTQQPVPVSRGRRHLVSLWARASNLASVGGLSIIVDDEWKVRPIRLPAGSCEWTRIAAEFVPVGDTAQIRILSEDTGEVWIDDLTVQLVTPRVAADEHLREFGELVRPRGRSGTMETGPGGGTLELDGGARAVVPAGAFEKANRLHVLPLDLDLQYVAFEVSGARVFSMSTDDHVAALGAPVVLEFPRPVRPFSVLEKSGGQWRELKPADGPTVKIEIAGFSDRLFATVEWKTPIELFDEGGLPLMEDLAAESESVREERTSPMTMKVRARQERGDEWTKKFYGIGEHTDRTPESFGSEMQKLLAPYAKGGKLDLPSDRPWTNIELIGYLFASGRPADHGGTYYARVKDSQTKIRDAVLGAPSPLSPGQLLKICIDANGGDVPLGVLAAANFTKDITNAGRLYSGVSSDKQVPREWGELASRLQTWRSEDIAKAGYYDKMGPLYHVFAAMTAGVWGGEGLADAAVEGEMVLRATGWTGDHPDPEKRDADKLGNSIAKWILRGMPGAQDLIEPVAKPPVADPPKPFTVSGRVIIGAGQPDASLILTIDAAAGTIAGSFVGKSVLTAPDGETTVTGSYIGTITGTYRGDAASGTLEGEVGMRVKAVTSDGDEAVGNTSCTLEGRLDGGTVTGTIKGEDGSTVEFEAKAP